MKTALQNRNRVREIQDLNDDDKSAHIFYTLESIIETAQELQNKLDVSTPMIAQRINSLENIDDLLQDLYNRVSKL